MVEYSFQLNPPPFIPRISWDEFGNKIFTFKQEGTITNTIPLPFQIEFSIKINILESPVLFSIGFSNKVINDTNRLYLGGDFGTGNWGINGRKMIGEEGNWKNCENYFSEGDIITLVLDNGFVRYKINGKENLYSYKFIETNEEYYLGISVTSDCNL